ncbi:MAG: hypothetical protein WC764_01165 [Candidatus Paceibacterota bacterium]|jgi:hypothetical protein
MPDFVYQDIVDDIKSVLKRRIEEGIKTGKSNNTAYCIEHEEKAFIVGIKDKIKREFNNKGDDHLVVETQFEKIERVASMERFFWRLRIIFHWTLYSPAGVK